VDNVILIKKYPNRRLYNTKTSGYITVKDVAALIESGQRVEVQDVTTNEDVTALVLTQIIMDKAKMNQCLLPVSLLHLVIQYGDNILNEFFEKHLEKTVESYLVYRKTMDDQVNAYLDMGMDFTNLAEKTFKEMDSMNMFSDIFKQYDKKK
jgi:polyhydroxyalkanoate synthesis repressor PhaR